MEHLYKEFLSRGLLKGPNESEEDYFKRCRSVSKNEINEIFGLKVDWIKVERGSQGLLPWEGAALFIEDEKSSLRIRKKILFYKENELISHELVHLIRMKFEEPRFEEVLAYQTSKLSLRKYFGPLFRSSNESLIFVIVMLSFSILQFFSPLAFLLSLAFSSFFLFRLIQVQTIFKRCQKKVKTCGFSQAINVMVRLSDKEIEHFSKMTSDEIMSYLKKNRHRFADLLAL